MSQWLNIIGVGEKGVGELPPHLRELITDAFTVIGPFRFLAGIKPIVEDIEVHPELVQQRSLEAVARALLYVDDEDVTVVEEEWSLSARSKTPSSTRVTCPLNDPSRPLPDESRKVCPDASSNVQWATGSGSVAATADELGAAANTSSRARSGAERR